MEFFSTNLDVLYSTYTKTPQVSEAWVRPRVPAHRSTGTKTATRTHTCKYPYPGPVMGTTYPCCSLSKDPRGTMQMWVQNGSVMNDQFFLFLAYLFLLMLFSLCLYIPANYNDSYIQPSFCWLIRTASFPHDSPWLILDLGIALGIISWLVRLLYVLLLGYDSFVQPHLQKYISRAIW